METVYEKLSKIPPTPLAEINMSVVNLIVQRYHDKSTIQSPEEIHLAEAAIAFQKAFAMKDYRSASAELTPDEQLSEEQVIAIAEQSFNGGYPAGGVHNGIKRQNAPRNAKEGERVTIKYLFLGRQCIDAGIVVKAFEFPTGRGLVVRLLETVNGYNISSSVGRRHVKVWMPAGNLGGDGFIY